MQSRKAEDGVPDMLKHLRRYIVAGLLVWLPLAATVGLLTFVIGVMDNWLDRAFALLPPEYHPDVLIGIAIPGLGVLFTLVLLILNGRRAWVGALKNRGLTVAVLLITLIFFAWIGFARISV